MYPQLATRLEGAVQGWQGKLAGTLTAVSGTPVMADIAGNTTTNAGAMQALVPASTGVVLTVGTYYFFIPAAGCSAVDVTLRASANATNIDATNTKLYKVLSDGVTEKMGSTGTSGAVTFAIFANATQQTASITTMRGERGCLLKLVLTGSVTFDQAEFSAL